MTFTPMAAELATERFNLTHEALADAAWLAELFTARGGGTVTETEARQRVLAMHELTSVHGIGAYVLRPRDGGPPVGYAAIVIGRGTVEEPEIAYELLPGAHGHGYATEAASAVLAAAFATGRRRVWSTIRPWNAASLRVLEKLGGFEQVRVTQDEKGQILWFACENPVGSPTRQVLFVQGAGAGTHDEWDNVLVDSLRARLGPGHEVRYPRMPDEDDPSYPLWSAAIWREIAGLDAGAVVVGHSVGGTILVRALSERPPERGLAAIGLIAAPFVGAGGWPSDEFALSSDLGGRMPPGVPVHVFHGAQDETVPPDHAELYARAIPGALVHVLPGRDHQLNGDLTELAEVIRGAVLSTGP